MPNKEEQPKMLTAENSGSVNSNGGLSLFIKAKTMKRTAIKIFMALVLALAMVIGLSSAAEAASKGRFMRIDLIDADYDMSGWPPKWVLPSASFSYNHIRVYGYEYQWFTQPPEYDATWEPWGSIETVSFGNPQSSGTNINLPLPGPWPDTLGGGHSMIVVYLLDKNGDYIRGFGPPEPEPSMGWNAGYGSFYFSAYSATGYTYQWTHDGVAVGDAVVVLFGEVLTSKTSCAVPKIGNDPGKWRVDVWLLGENGHKIQKAHLTYGFQPF